MLLNQIKHKQVKVGIEALTDVNKVDGVFDVQFFLLFCLSGVERMTRGIWVLRLICTKL